MAEALNGNGNGDLERMAQAARAGRLGADAVEAAEVLVRTAEGDRRVPVAVGSFMLLSQILEEIVRLRQAVSAVAGATLGASSEPPA